LFRAFFCLAVAALLAAPKEVRAAHTYDTKAGTPTYLASDPKQLAFTCATGTTLLVVMVYHNHTSRTGGAPTFHGVTMTQVGTEVLNAQEVGVEMWYLVDPDAGAEYIINVENDSSISLRIVAASFAAQSGYTSELDQNTSTNVDAQSPSLSRTTTVDGDVCLDVLGHGQSDPPSAHSNSTLYVTDEGFLTFSTQYALQANYGAITMSHTTANSDDVAMIMACFKEVVASSDSTATLSQVSATATIQGFNEVRGAAAPALTQASATATAGELHAMAPGGGDEMVMLEGSTATATAGTLGISSTGVPAFSQVSATGTQGILAITSSGAPSLSGNIATALPGDMAVSGSVVAGLSGAIAVASAGTLEATSAGTFNPWWIPPEGVIW
jgi:hypothetical protein